MRQLLAPILFEDRKLTNQLWEHVSDGWNNIDLALFIIYGFAIGIRMTTGPDACVTSHASQLPPTDPPCHSHHRPLLLQMALIPLSLLSC